jgi:chromate reductase, NAD(P)H dehydrogenase (quinone)
MSKTLIISGTNRKSALTQIVAKKYFELYSQNNAAETKYFSLENLPDTIAFSETFGQRSAEYETFINENIAWADKFVFLIPEYNGSFPGIIKLMIDSIQPKHFNFKKAAIVGVATGRAGNLRGMAHFSEVLNHIKVNVYFDKPPVSLADKLISDNELTDTATIEVLNRQIKGFLAF